MPVTVLRIIANLEASDPIALASFYTRLLGLDLVMDHGWIATLAAPGAMRPQVSFAREGGSGTPVPALSIEVDNLDAVLERATAEAVEIVYPLTQEPWGVRRFFIRDPAGRLINILTHRPEGTADA